MKQVECLLSGGSDVWERDVHIRENLVTDIVTLNDTQKQFTCHALQVRTSKSF